MNAAVCVLNTDQETLGRAKKQCAKAKDTQYSIGQKRSVCYLYPFAERLVQTNYDVVAPGRNEGNIRYVLFRQGTDKGQ